MFTAAYNAYYWEEHQLAKQQLAFFENKLKKIDDEPCNTANKSIRKRTARAEHLLHTVHLWLVDSQNIISPYRNLGDAQHRADPH
jgi:ABC-type transport system involved in cytochrome c biogenesis ATPase subunit